MKSHAQKELTQLQERLINCSLETRPLRIVFGKLKADEISVITDMYGVSTLKGRLVTDKDSRLQVMFKK